MTAIVVTVDDASPARLSAPGPHAIGRDAMMPVTVSDRRVSRRHGVFELRGDAWWFVDDSSSGTWLDGSRVTSVLVGDTPLQLRLGAADGPSVMVVSAPPVVVPGARATSVLIGRDDHCTVRLDDLSVSRRHAEMQRSGDGTIVLRDLGSANGTYVDGQRISGPTALYDGSRVSVGAQVFRMLDGDLVPWTSLASDPLRAMGISVVVANGRRILDRVSMDCGFSTMTAVVGPSGAGKSTLLRVLTGQEPPACGTVDVDGQDLYRWYEQVRSNIAYVPQADIIHLQLSARRCLAYAAELRFPDDTSASERERRVAEVLVALDLAECADQPVSTLSGGQRKRASVALELLTQPELLFLDEPTSGLDPGLEQSAMQVFRRLADDGRCVVVVTHSVASLDLCDQVLFLARGGRVAFQGSLAEALAHFGVPSVPDLFRSLAAGPTVDASEVDDRARDTAPSPAEIEADSLRDVPAPNPFSHQLKVLVRRQAALLTADPRTILMLVMGALVPSALVAMLVEPQSLSMDGANGGDGRTLLGAMVVTIGVLGVANTAREIVKESPIYVRERTAGLRRTAYLCSKLAVFGVITTLQACIVVGVATARAGGPADGNLLPGRLELVVDLAATGIATMTLGLLISAIVKNSEKAVALIPIAFVALWLFSGAVADLTEQPVLSDVALLSPSNWGLAAAASTSDLSALEGCEGTGVDTTGVSAPVPASAPVPPQCDRRWERGIGRWVLDMVVLVALTAAGALLAEMALARKEPLPRLRRQHVVGRWFRKARDATTRARAGAS